MNKAAQMSAANLGEMLSRFGTNAASLGGSAGSSIKDWWGSINPELKATLLRGALGAAAGGGGLALLRKLQGVGSDDESLIPTPGMGALLGGLGAAGLPLGMKMMTGKVKFPGETPAKPGSRGIDNIIEWIAGHPGTTAGTALSGVWAGRHMPTRSNVLRELKGYDWQTLAPAHKQMLRRDVLKPMEQLWPGQAALSPLGKKIYRAAGMKVPRGGRAVVAGRAAIPLKWRMYQSLMKPGTKGVGAAAIPLLLGSGLLLDRYWRGQS
jgi:hypothetical protein